jgi:hypothetical protein
VAGAEFGRRWCVRYSQAGIRRLNMTRLSLLPGRIHLDTGPRDRPRPPGCVGRRRRLCAVEAALRDSRFRTETIGTHKRRLVNACLPVPWLQSRLIGGSCRVEFFARPDRLPVRTWIAAGGNRVSEVNHGIEGRSLSGRSLVAFANQDRRGSLSTLLGIRWAVRTFRK